MASGREFYRRLWRATPFRRGRQPAARLTSGYGCAGNVSAGAAVCRVAKDRRRVIRAANTRRKARQIKKLLIGIAAAAAGWALTTVPARAGVNWSIGITLPPIGAVVSGGPEYRYQPDYPVYSAYPVYPAYGPVYGVVAPPVVYRRPPPVYYRPVAPVVYAPHWRTAPAVVYGGRGDDWRHDRRGDFVGRRDARPVEGGRDARWAPVPDDGRRFRH